MDFKPFKIGKYLLLERLAMGGMAEVYRAKASGAGGFEKQLAIKRILPNYSENTEFRRMFEYEARLSSMLTHSNIVQVYDFVKSGETYLLAMEYVDGKNLRQFLNKLKKFGLGLPLDCAIHIINETCKGLEYAHTKKDDLTGRSLNIIHRDMSPQNIMISYDGGIKIVDFGIAKAKDRVDETRSGVIKGKFGYMSPEQANGEAVDHRTDIFSTAIILWELVTGKRLFATDNDMATLKLIQECVIPSPSKLNPKITAELEKLVLKGLTKDLTLRYQSAGNFHRLLQEFLNKYFPSFTQRELADLMQKAFADEIRQEKKRFEQIYRQSIPFSQGAATQDEGEGSKPSVASAIDIDEDIDGSITASETNEKTEITSLGDPEEENKNNEQLAKDYTNPDTQLSVSVQKTDNTSNTSNTSNTANPLDLNDPQSQYTEAKTEAKTQARTSVKPASPDEEDREVTEKTDIGTFDIEEETSITGLGPDISWNSEIGAPGTKNAKAPKAPESKQETSTELRKDKTDPSVKLVEPSLPEEDDKTVIDSDPLAALADDSSIKTPDEGETTNTQKTRKPEISISRSPVERKKPNATPVSGLTLEDKSESGSTSARRERSVSFLKKFQKEQKPATSANQSTPSPASQYDPSGTNSQITPELQVAEPVVKKRIPSQKNINRETDAWSDEPPKRQTLLLAARNVITVMLLLVMLSLVIEVYRVYLRGDFPKFVGGMVDKVNGVSGRDLTQSPPSPSPVVPSTVPQAETRPSFENECPMTFESDPSGASVFIGEVEKGKTPTTLVLECQKAVNVRIRKFGYEPVSENIFVKGRENKIYKTLKMIPMGVLRLRLNRNAVVEVTEIGYLKEVQSGEWFELSLPAGRKHTVRFVNQVLGINVKRDFSVQENARLEERVNLEDLANK